MLLSYSYKKGNGREMESQESRDQKTTFQQTLKFYVLAAFNVFSFVVFLGYGIYNLVQCHFTIGVFEVGVAFVLAVTLYYVVKKRITGVPGTVNIIVLQIMGAYLYISGGVSNSGIFWLFLFPITYFFFKGSRQGIVWFLLQMSMMSIVFMLSWMHYIEIPYSGLFFAVSVMVLIIEAAVLFVHEKITEDNLAQIKILQGLLPICSFCKKIRQDDGYWNHIELYIKEHSDATFTHGLCPDCARKLYPELFVEKSNNQQG